MNNLEVDVIEGDGFEYSNGYTRQHRTSMFREIGMKRVFQWAVGNPYQKGEPIDLATFTRYCEGCGLTVKVIKPEPQVETIKPPEWTIRWEDGRRELFDDSEAATVFLVESRRAGRVVRIDWENKESTNV